MCNPLEGFFNLFTEVVASCRPYSGSKMLAMKKSKYTIVLVLLAVAVSLVVLLSTTRLVSFASPNKWQISVQSDFGVDATGQHLTRRTLTIGPAKLKLK